MEGEKCVKCGWVINRPVSEQELKLLLSTTNKFISDKISNRHAKDVVKKVLQRLEWQKELNHVYSNETPVCRYCLFELVQLFMRKEEHLFEKEFIRNYDFDESIIC